MIILEDTRNQVGKHDKSSESTMDFEPSRKKNCENVYTIYMHICPNGKRYVGYTSTTISQRSGATGKRYKPNKRFYPILGRIPPLLSEVKVGDECRLFFY